MSLVAAPLLVTSAFALEDIKVDGQVKLWYESNNAAGTDGSDTMFNTENSSAEVVFKLGMTGKQGDVSFGTTIYQSSTMGLEGTLVGAARTNAVNGDMFVGEAYIVAPLGGDTITKIGKQELDTPLAFTERWNAIPNTFNAAVVMNNSVDNLTLLAAYVGQDNATTWKVDGEVNQKYFGATGAAAALFKTETIAANAWFYYLHGVGGAMDPASTTAQWTGGQNVSALWADASMKIGDVANVKVIGAYMANDGDATTALAGGLSGEATTAAALSGDMTFGGVKLFAAGAYVGEDGDLPVANTATGFKKTKLPTAGVYTDGVYVAQPGSISGKIKASGKVASTGLALQAVMNVNSDARFELANGDNTKDTTEVDFIVTQKMGVFNNKLILMHRGFSASALDDTTGGQHVRLITSVNF